ncbi:MAG: N-acetyl-gamma-glutamyl-phosphate reductase [Bacteroidales bacterium]|nr:N-acetyl-gamma-glutamyl-phosphate reductase [Bacteroidales bacterium]
MDKKKIGIVGATGFTGSELLRILIHHPDVEVEVLCSESKVGESISDIHPFFREIVDNQLEPVDNILSHDLDLVFLALPHGISMNYVKLFSKEPFKIVDLSGDFRLSSKQVYEEWYTKEHIFPEGIDRAVFGIPELFANEINGADLVANPGCYPTSAILGAAPLIKNKMVDTEQIIIDSKSGLTGAGNKAKRATHYSGVNENFKAYGITNHRHTIEIQEAFDRLFGKKTQVQFTPHLLPVDRGILSTMYFRSDQKMRKDELTKVYTDFYQAAPFVRICDDPPAIKEVRGSNYCNISITPDERTGWTIVVSVIDNLVKGAAGQAVQNMNLMLGLEEQSGLNLIPVSP